MTTDELNAIVQAVMTELEKAGVDFDFKAEVPQPTDLVYVMRGTADKYQGITVKWQNLLDIIVKKATDAKDEAVSAKDIALQTLATIQGIESNVSTMKTSVEATKSQVETMKTSVETNEANVTQMKTSVEGTKREVENMKNDVNDIYNDFNNLKVILVSQLYPVGSIYMSLKDECSPASIIANSSWERLPEGKALWTASSGLSITDDSVNTVDAGLPNITGADALGLSGGYFGLKSNFTHVNGAFNTDNSLKYMAESGWVLPALEEVTKAKGYSNKLGVAFDASKGETRLDGTLSNLVYGKNDTVQPPAYKVYAWKRIA